MKPILLLTAVVMLAGCHLSPKTTDSQETIKAFAAAPGMNGGTGRYGIKAIPGWTKKDTSMNGVHFTAVICDTIVGGFHPNVNVVTQSMTLSLDDCFAQSIEGMRQYLANFKVMDKGSGTLNGHDSRWLRYSSTVDGKDNEGMLTCVVSGGIAYVVTCTAARGHYDDSKAAFDAIVNSFSVE
ncbi:MAG TPA: PsbP-related protein [Dinghuibacter sp.]|uniref:PsbP-related protein n=1 Tax=Dinghuibacter sp. TaxID=2024697 RepID=UPI002C59D210|nr:PsbP-related protein [Dinghuibacter sp.]HTJ10451.1 PsbP-related protein [Dinghuibacter sp.]